MIDVWNQIKDRANEDLAYVIAICSLGIGGITGNVLILKRKLFQTNIEYDFRFGSFGFT